MKKLQKILLILLLFAAFICSLMPFIYLPSQFLTTSGLLLDLAGLLQLNISEFFEKIITKCCDIEKYPYGPPSSITREIIDNPDTPFKTSCRNWLFFKPKMGLCFLTAGIILQLIGVWVEKM